MEFLKSIFGEEALTYDQFSEKLKDNKEIKIGNLAGGQYVDKDKHEAATGELEGLREQIKTANETIEGFKKLDVEGMKKAVSDWEQKYEADTKSMAEKLKAQTRDSKIDIALMGAKAKNVKAARALLDLEKISLDGDNLLGLQEQLSSVAKDNPYLFDVTNNNPPPPAQGGAATPPATLQSAVSAAIETQMKG